MSLEVCYGLRFTTENEEIVLQFLKQYAKKWMYGREIGGDTGKTHFHLYIETVSKNPAIRAWIRKYIGSGNGIYTMKEVEKNPVQYLAYSMKDGNYIFSENYTEEEIQAIRTYDAKVKAEIKERKEKKKNKKSYIVKYVQKNLPGTYFIREKLRDSPPDFYLLRKETMLILIRYCREDDRYPSITRIRSESLYVIQKLFGDLYDQEILELCL